ncbi:MAG: hypothetical protein Kow00124_30670 [Anaerolineae bacterium]
MSVSVSWDEGERDLLLVQYVDPWTWQEYFDMADELAVQAASAGRPVDVIMDIRQGAGRPSELPSLWPMSARRPGQTMRLGHPEVRMLVIVGTRGMQAWLGGIVAATVLYRLGNSVDLATADRIEQAYDLIAQRRALHATA